MRRYFVVTGDVLRRHAVLQHARRVALAQPLERPIAKLPYTLTRDAEIARDFLQRHRTIALEAEVQNQHSAVARCEHVEGTRDRLSARVALDAAWQHVLVLAPIQHQSFAERATRLAGNR